VQDQCSKHLLSCPRCLKNFYRFLPNFIIDTFVVTDLLSQCGGIFISCSCYFFASLFTCLLPILGGERAIRGIKQVSARFPLLRKAGARSSVICSRPQKYTKSDPASCGLRGGEFVMPYLLAWAGLPHDPTDCLCPDGYLEPVHWAP